MIEIRSESSTDVVESNSYFGRIFWKPKGNRDVFVSAIVVTGGLLIASTAGLMLILAFKSIFGESS